MAHFYATAEDLLPVLSAVESRRQLKYTLTGHHASPEAATYSSGCEIPTLNVLAAFSSASSCPAYLVSLKEQPVVPRMIKLSKGGVVWAIDQMLNPESTVLWHGGIYKELVLLHGRVATGSKSATALSLQRAFDNQLKKHFKRIQSFYVGPRAEQLLNEGFRLAPSVKSPPAYDLRR